MIVLSIGNNTASWPRADLPESLPAVFVIRLVNDSTKKEHWCRVEDDESMIDWINVTITIKAAGAIATNGELAIKLAGDYSLELYGGSSYVENPKVLDLILTERARCVF